MELRLGRKTSMNKLRYISLSLPVTNFVYFDYLPSVCFMCQKSTPACTYMFVFEGLHQLRHPAEGHGEGQMWACVAVRHLDTLVAKIPLPFGVTTDFILTKDVRY